MHFHYAFCKHTCLCVSRVELRFGLMLMNRGLCMTFTLHSGWRGDYPSISVQHPQTSSSHHSIPRGRKRLFFHVSPVFHVFPLLAPSCFPPSINPTETTKEKKERRERNRMRREITNDDLPRHGTTQVAISATRSISLMNLSDLMTPKYTLPLHRLM